VKAILFQISMPNCLSNSTLAIPIVTFWSEHPML